MSDLNTLGSSRLIPLGAPESNEREALLALDQALDPSWIIFHSRKPLRGRLDIDCLIVAPHGVFVVEFKNFRGRIAIKTGPHWHRQLEDGTETQIPNVLQGQAQKQAQLLKSEFKGRAGLHHVWIEPVVLFTHPQCQLDFSSVDASTLQEAVFKLSEAPKRLGALIEANKTKRRRAISRDDAHAIAALLDAKDSLPVNLNWPSVAPVQEKGQTMWAEDRRERHSRRRSKQIMVILTLLGALFVTIAIYLVIFHNPQTVEQELLRRSAQQTPAHN